MKTEADYFEQRGIPVPGDKPHERVIHGLCLPLYLARALLSDPVARKRYLWVCTLQFLAILGLGLVFMKSGQVAANDVHARASARGAEAEASVLDSDDEDGEEVDAEEEAAAQTAMEALKKDFKEDLKRNLKKNLQKDLDKAEREAREQEDARAAVETAASVLQALGVDAKVHQDPESRRITVKIDSKEEPSLLPPLPPLPPGPEAPPLPTQAEEAHQQGVAAAKAAVEEFKAGRVQEAMRHAEAAAKQLERAEEQEARKGTLRLKRFRKATVTDLEFWAALLAAMHITQWVVIALTRDYHDAIARDLSLLTRLEPEDGPMQPRIRLNIPWLRAKMKRRWRAMMLFFMAAPFLWLVTLPLPGHSALFTALMSVWGAWWYVVFSAAKSNRAWKDEAAPTPLFLRGWTWLTTHIPGFRWGLPKRYGSGMEKLTRTIYSPVATVERQPWEYAGLAMLRAAAMIPGLKVFVRPLIPVASAHLIEAHQVAHPALPATTTLPATVEPAPVKVASGS